MNAPITSLIQKSTKGGMKVQQPLLNVGGKSCGCTSDCDCESPAKYAPMKKKSCGYKK